jgi:hypothetical protein
MAISSHGRATRIQKEKKLIRKGILVQSSFRLLDCWFVEGHSLPTKYQTMHCGLED